MLVTVLTSTILLCASVLAGTLPDDDLWTDARQPRRRADTFPNRYLDPSEAHIHQVKRIFIENPRTDNPAPPHNDISRRHDETYGASGFSALAPRTLGPPDNGSDDAQDSSATLQTLQASQTSQMPQTAEALQTLQTFQTSEPTSTTDDSTAPSIATTPPPPDVVPPGYASFETYTPARPKPSAKVRATSKAKAKGSKNKKKAKAEKS